MTIPGPWPWILGAAAGGATVGGGLIGLRPGSHRPLIVAFSAGAVIGVALLDLAPESLDLAGPARGGTMFGLIALGFAGYLILSRTLERVAFVRNQPGASQRAQEPKDRARFSVFADSTKTHRAL
ncbi:MAG: hypothetical protein KGL69_06610, partial [Alphaproteobacteria bacterium]|nr:hypothetical protein [Alphaproteobacteria bacterium]